MNVVPEAGIVAILVRVQSPAHFHIFFDHHDLLAALGQIAGADHAVVPGADHDAVVFEYLRHSLRSLNDLNDLNCLNISVVQIVPTVPTDQIAYGTSTLNLKLQVFFHHLPAIASGSGNDGVRRMRGDPDLIESFNGRSITRELFHRPVDSHLFANLARQTEPRRILGQRPEM